MDLLVNAFAQDNELVYGKDTVNSIYGVFKPFHKPLTAKQRQGVRAVGSSRYGLVKVVERIANQYDGKLSKEDNAAELSKRVAYLDKIRQYKLAVMNLLEALDDTDKAIGQDVMAHVDKFSASLQNARQHDGDLDEAMKALDEYNSRFGAAMEQEDEEEKEKEKAKEDKPKVDTVDGVPQTPKA